MPLLFPLLYLDGVIINCAHGPLDERRRDLRSACDFCPFDIRDVSFNDISSLDMPSGAESSEPLCRKRIDFIVDDIHALPPDRDI